MTADNKFRDGVATGSNELASRLIIMLQWGSEITEETVRNANRILINGFGGDILDVNDPYPEVEEGPEQDPDAVDAEEVDPS